MYENLESLPAWKRKEVIDANSAAFFQWLKNTHPQMRLTLWQIETAAKFYSVGRGGGKTFLLQLLQEFEEAKVEAARQEQVAEVDASVEPVPIISPEPRCTCCEAVKSGRIKPRNMTGHEFDCRVHDFKMSRMGLES